MFFLEEFSLHVDYQMIGCFKLTEFLVVNFLLKKGILEVSCCFDRANVFFPPFLKHDITTPHYMSTVYIHEHRPIYV